MLMRQFPKEVQVSIEPDNNTGRRRGAFRTAHEEWHGAGGPGLQAAIEGVDAVQGAGRYSARRQGWPGILPPPLRLRPPTRHVIPVHRLCDQRS